MSGPFTGVRGRVTFAVLAVAAVVFSIVGTVGFLALAHSGRNAVRDRIGQVVDDLEVRVRAHTGTLDVRTADGVIASVVDSTAAVPVSNGDVLVSRLIIVDGQAVRLVGRSSDAPLADSLRTLFRGVWIAVPLATVLCALLAGLATRRALRPVAAITALAERIGGAPGSARVPVPDTDDEIEHLAITLNAMLGRIEAGRLRQRQFTSDAAHELRTPLMALQGELELAERAPHAVGRETFTRMRRLARRLGERVDDLVLLATLDESRPLARVPTPLLDLVGEEVASVDASVSVIGEPVEVAVDRSLVARAVRNLVANAQRHARSTVSVSIERCDAGVTVHVDDDGPGIPAGQRDEVFRRFARLDEARGADGGGSGLGLAIVLSVAVAHGGTATAGASDMGGARLSLQLPLAET